MDLVKLRNEYEEKANKLPDDEELFIEESLLNKLLFHRENGRNYLIWSGKFLSKIDLSLIDFSEVEWNVNYKDEVKDYYETGPGIVHNVYKKYNVDHIDLSNTNANMMFSYRFGPIVMENCNFANVDLSYCNFNFVNKAKNCDFSNTNIECLDRYFGNGFNNCNFSNNDFNGCDAHTLKFNFSNNFYNTGLKVHHVLDDYLVYYEKDDKLSKEQLEIINDMLYKVDMSRDKDDLRLLAGNFKRFQKNSMLSKMIRNNYLDGCYINGKRIYLAEEKKEIKDTVREYYKLKR